MSTVPETTPAGNACPDDDADWFPFPVPEAPTADAVATPDAVPPFPEPPAGLPLGGWPGHRLAIYRTAWPTLTADQRAMVRSDVDTAVYLARRCLELEQHERAKYTPADLRRAKAARPLLAAAWAGLDTLADACDELADDLARRAGYTPNEWATADLPAAAHALRAAAGDVADALELDERERDGEGVIPRPELPDGYEADPPGERAGVLGCFAVVCLRAADRAAEAAAGSPYGDHAWAASACRHAAHVARRLLGIDPGPVELVPSAAAAERVAAANGGAA